MRRCIDLIIRHDFSYPNLDHADCESLTECLHSHLFENCDPENRPITEDYFQKFILFPFSEKETFIKSLRRNVMDKKVNIINKLKESVTSNVNNNELRSSCHLYVPKDITALKALTSVDPIKELFKWPNSIEHPSMDGDAVDNYGVLGMLPEEILNPGDGIW